MQPDSILFMGDETPETVAEGADALFRGFHHFGSAWYANANHLKDDITDVIDFGMYCADGSAEGGAAMVWYSQGPRLEVFHDGWSFLTSVRDLLDKLAALDLAGAAGRLTPAEFCDLLLALGFRDLTEREKPLAAGDTRYLHTSDYGWLLVLVESVQPGLALVCAWFRNERLLAGEVVDQARLEKSLPAGALALNEVAPATVAAARVLACPNCGATYDDTGDDVVTCTECHFDFSRP